MIPVPTTKIKLPVEQPMVAFGAAHGQFQVPVYKPFMQHRFRLQFFSATLPL